MRKKIICLWIMGFFIISLFSNISFAQDETLSLEDFKTNPTVERFSQLSPADKISYLQTNYDGKYAKEYISRSDLAVTNGNKELIKKILRDNDASGETYTGQVLVNARRYLNNILEIVDKEDKEIAERYCSSLGNVKCSDFKNAGSIQVEEQDGKLDFHFNNIKKGDKIVFSPDGKTKIEYRAQQEGSSFHAYPKKDGFVIDAKKKGFFRVGKEKYSLGADGQLLATFDAESRLRELNGNDWLYEKPAFTEKNKGFFRSSEGLMKISYDEKGNPEIDETTGIKLGELPIREDSSALSGKGSFKEIEFIDGKVRDYTINEGIVHYTRRGNIYAQFKTTKNPIAIFEKSQDPEALKGLYGKGETSFGYIDKDRFPVLMGRGKAARPGASFTSERDMIVKLHKELYDNYFDVAYVKPPKGDGPVATAYISGRTIVFEQKGDILSAKTSPVSNEEDFSINQVSFYKSIAFWKEGEKGLRILDKADGIVVAQAKEVYYAKSQAENKPAPSASIFDKIIDYVSTKTDATLTQLKSLIPGEVEQQPKTIGQKAKFQIRMNEFQSKVNSLDSMIALENQKISYMKRLEEEALKAASWTPEGELEEAVTGPYQDKIRESTARIKSFEERQNELRNNIKILEGITNQPVDFSNDLLKPKEQTFIIKNLADYDNVIKIYQPGAGEKIVVNIGKGTIELTNLGGGIYRLFDGQKNYDYKWELLTGKWGIRGELKKQLEKGPVTIKVSE